MTKKTFVLFIVIPLLFLAAINYRLAKSMKHPGSKQKALTDQDATLNNTKSRKADKTDAQIADTSAKGNIIIRKETDLPRHQFQWDIYMKKHIEDSKIFETEAGKKSFEKMKTTPEEFHNTMERVDKQISEFETKLSEDPLDKNAEERLQVLYRLKAMGKVLESKGITLPKAPSSISE